jgi:hypothetical protein
MAAFCSGDGPTSCGRLAPRPPEGPLDGLDDMKAVQLLCLEEASAEPVVIDPGRMSPGGIEPGRRVPVGASARIRAGVRVPSWVWHQLLLPSSPRERAPPGEHAVRGQSKPGQPRHRAMSWTPARQLAEPWPASLAPRYRARTETSRASSRQAAPRRANPGPATQAPGITEISRACGVQDAVSERLPCRRPGIPPRDGHHRT